MSEDGFKTKLVRAVSRADHWIGPNLCRRPMRFGYWFVGSFVRMLFRIVFGMRILEIGNVPRTGRLLIVANHTSNLDPPIIGCTVPREIHFAAKIQLFKGVLGKLISYLNAMPIRRTGSDKDAIKRLVGVLRDEGALLMFPEGTRQKDGSGGEAKAGPGMVATLGKADVLPIKLSGTSKPKYAFFHRGTMAIRYGEVIPFAEISAAAKELAGPDAGKKEIYQALSDVAMEHVRAL
ncbi:1-acyl-sn-glycerol-3-phosphate acyltransferase [bacterium]|nr:1-acyl-sn-glycerol-3-phosphate acyltransferase [bacterium]